MKRFNEKLLAKYYDGELSDKQTKAVEMYLASSETAQESLQKMTQLSDLFKIMNEEQLSDISFEGFEARVQSGIAQSENQGFTSKARMWLSEFFEHRKSVWVPATSFAGAAAVALLLVPLFGKAPLSPVSPQIADQELWTASADVVTTQGGSEVVLLNHAQISGTEYSLKNDRGESIGVIWITD